MTNETCISTDPKPTIRFYPPAYFRPAFGDGEIALVVVEHHPYTKTNHVATSTVVKKNDDGSFETLNSLYVPYDYSNKGLEIKETVLKLADVT